MIELALFDTPIGRCGIVWEGDRIEGTQLPALGRPTPGRG